MDACDLDHTALDVAGSEAEIALRMRRLPRGGPLAGCKLGRVAFTVYAARGLRDELGRPDGDWRGLGVVGLPETARAPSQSRWLDAVAAQRGAAPRLRFGEVALRQRAVREGAGASLLPCFLGDADPALVRLLDPPPELAEDVYLLHEAGILGGGVSAFAGEASLTPWRCGLSSQGVVDGRAGSPREDQRDE